MAKITVRKGMPSVQLDKAEFKKRFLAKFYDPDYDPLKRDLDKIIDTAWITYDEYHKTPRTRKAGPGFADPKFRSFDRMAGDARQYPGSRAQAEESEITLAHPDRQRFLA